ncbi:MAG: hypothetical protein KIH63_000070 [Candidatus Saccharibacteria bacterium]|nr:hypothetical protein [Candidatus Saccharibacteria bacterium]
MKSIKPEPVIVLVGLGLHAKRIYLPYLAQNKQRLGLVIDLESNSDAVNQYLKDNGIDCQTYFIANKQRDDEKLNKRDESNIAVLCRDLGITHAIISTEPKAHKAYAKFFVPNGIDTLVDKPITSPLHPSTKPKQARKIYKDYKELALLAKNPSHGRLTVQAQRRFHVGYLFVYDLINKIIADYNVPITYLDTYHCDGLWSMPPEFVFRENHPYKYGYGKLMHSGYHFVDVAAWFLDLNNQIVNKCPDNAEVANYMLRPSDFTSIVDEDNYKQFFGEQVFSDHFNTKHQMAAYGEIDSSSVLRMKRGDKTVALCSINLLQNGFSRRSWPDLPQDTYKSNGRIRHERLSVQVGPLLNVQIHSYESYEIKDKHKHAHELFDTGNNEHFDIYIYRNSDLIGGKAYEKIGIEQLYKHEGSIGHNEAAREKCLMQFLSGSADISDIAAHNSTNRLLSNLYLAACNDFKGRPAISKFKLGI